MDRKNYNSKFENMKNEVLANKDVSDFLQSHKNELASDAADRGIAKLYEFVQQSSKKTSSSFAQDYEPYLIVAQHLIDIAYKPSNEKIVNDKQSRLAKMVKMVNVPKDVRSARIDSYEATEGRILALSESLDFIKKVTVSNNQFVVGLYLYGLFGRGKTYLLAAIANELAGHGIPVTLLHLPTFAVEVKDSIQNGGVLAKVDAVKKVPILFLDDIGAESFSPWFRDEVLGVILQYRMQEQLTTCFSSNKSKAELKNFFAGRESGGKEDIKAGRIMERVNYLSKEILITGNDRRVQN
jgi:primosomal protein DnaI